MKPFFLPLTVCVYPRWNSCKQNKQAANNRAATANQTSPSPEGEKLHSDSGISVDSQSLQEQQQLQTQAEAHTQTQTQLHMPEQTGKICQELLFHLNTLTDVLLWACKQVS